MHMPPNPADPTWRAWWIRGESARESRAVREVVADRTGDPALREPREAEDPRRRKALVWILAKPRIFSRMSPIDFQERRLTPVPPQ
jgi:hypothetical protein